MAEAANQENVNVSFPWEEFNYNLEMMNDTVCSDDYESEKQLVLYIEAENINTKELWSTKMTNERKTENSFNLKPATILKIFHDFQVGKKTDQFSIKFPQNFDVKSKKPLELSIDINHDIEEFCGKCPIELDKVYMTESELQSRQIAALKKTVDEQKLQINAIMEYIKALPPPEKLKELIEAVSKDYDTNEEEEADGEIFG